MINESLLQPDTPSALDICNAALSKIGEAPLDALIANESTASRLCVLHYHPFTLPADCLRVLDVECSERKMQGRRIQASCAPLPLSYIADIENADQFDPLFMDALATRLAEKLAMPLTGNQNLRQNLNQEFHKIILPQAATVNAVQCFSNDSHPLLDLLRKIKSPSCPEECE